MIQKTIFYRELYIYGNKNLLDPIINSDKIDAKMISQEAIVKNYFIPRDALCTMDEKQSHEFRKQTSKYAYTHVRLTVANGAGGLRAPSQWRLSRNRSYSGERNVVSGAYEKLFIVCVSGRYIVAAPLHFIAVQHVRPLYD